MKRKCIIVLGMHRSGTSALTGCLAKMGVFLGNNLMSGTCDNEKGYFENLEISTFNHSVMSEHQYTWSDLPPILEYNNQHIEKLVDILNRQFKHHQLFAIKDPRIIYLFRLYEQALSKLNIEINIILPYRNPFEVAASLTKRNGFSHDKGVYLWLYNFLLAEFYSRKYKRCIIKFSDLLNQPYDTLSYLEKVFTIDFKTKQLDGFLDANLKHHYFDDDFSKYADWMLPQVIFQINSLGSQEQFKLYDKVLDRLREQISFLDRLGATHSDYYTEALSKLINSKSWKLTKPLRYLKKLLASNCDSLKFHILYILTTIWMITGYNNKLLPQEFLFHIIN